MYALFISIYHIIILDMKLEYVNTLRLSHQKKLLILLEKINMKMRPIGYGFAMGK